MVWWKHLKSIYNWNIQLQKVRTTNLLLKVCVISDVNKVVHLGRADLLNIYWQHNHFSGYYQFPLSLHTERRRRDMLYLTHQSSCRQHQATVVLTINYIARKITIYVVNRQKQSFRYKTILFSNLQWDQMINSYNIAYLKRHQQQNEAPINWLK